MSEPQNVMKIFFVESAMSGPKWTLNGRSVLQSVDMFN